MADAGPGGKCLNYILFSIIVTMKTPAPLLVMGILLLLVFLPGCTGPDQGSPGNTTPGDLSFSGHAWQVKTSTTPVGPGPNLFSANTSNVRVDDQGYLHMRITKEGDHWECAEVISRENFGYGEYAFTLGSDPESLDRESVLGLFTWADRPEYAHREIDIELSRWEDPANMDAQYVLQPWNSRDHIHRFTANAAGNVTTHSFRWEEGHLAFQSYFGPYTEMPAPETVIESWEYAGSDVPRPGPENARINFWLDNGKPLSYGNESEVVIRQFRFVPER